MYEMKNWMNLPGAKECLIMPHEGIPSGSNHCGPKEHEEQERRLNYQALYLWRLSVCRQAREEMEAPARHQAVPGFQGTSSSRYARPIQGQEMMIQSHDDAMQLRTHQLVAAIGLPRRSGGTGPLAKAAPTRGLKVHRFGFQPGFYLPDEEY